MSDDLGGRADEYERRLQMAGGTDPLLGGLVQSIRQTKRVSTITTVGLVLDIILTVVLAVVAQNARHTAESLAQTDREACMHSNVNTAALNSFVDVLIENTRKNTGFMTPPEIHTRISSYRTLKVDLLQCG